ncbi:F5/8 type C domain-containing protein [Cellulosimicrobium aquatile]|uniref:beta-N-acetylhexosaminidase n=1 Tax=Cellulosimicrobium aquatile TaxID=1612203 RepID=A0A1N6PRW6_9MICO|nr:family 20 glycosylhydrolase [Cellulosimicrobium aquatile]SIQ06949.1 F5/8 type C domain-containing protein [Cellulosimicrobium aquatile]
MPPSPASPSPANRGRARRRLVALAGAALALATATPATGSVAPPDDAAAATAVAPGSNVALASAGGVVTASGSEGGGTYGWTPDKAIDGITSGPVGQHTSRWSSDASDAAWLMVELAEPTVIDHVNIYWETACAARYVLQVSHDGTSWTDATPTVSPACGALDRQTVGAQADPAAAYRFVRMQTIERTPVGNQKYGVSLWELEVWDGTEPTPRREPALVPRPALVEQGDTASAFRITPETAVVAHGAGRGTADLVAELLRPATGYALPVVDGGDDRGAIAVTVDPEAGYTVEGGPAADESYVLDVDEGGVRIVATTSHGAFNAVQTLRQLLPAWVESDVPVAADWAVPAIHVEDAPRFAYRGVMLDPARSFQTVEAIKRQIDVLSQLKLSVLHLHLADDQGWRIEITNEGRVEGDTIDYTRLVDVSGRTAMDSRGYRDEVGRTGYYTQDEYRDIVAYAAERFVTVVPEVDVPGHTNAALHAIPELNTSRSLPAPDPATGVVPWNGTGNVGYSALDERNEASYTFVRHVFRQLAEMTGGPYVHMGGDETHAMGHDRFVDFVTRAVPDIQEVTGRGVIGWNEYAAAGAGQPDDFWEGSIAQYWVGSADPLRDFVAKGGKAIVSNATGAYLDQKYTSDTPIGLSWACGGTCDADRYYDWEPTTTVPGGIDEESVLGVEAPLWSETVRGGDQLEFLLLPRAASVLETGWTAREDKDVASFMQRLGDLGPRLTVQGHGFYESPRTTWAATSVSADVDARSGATAAWPVGYVAAPGTKLAADGARIAPDVTAADGDPATRSVLTEPLTAELVCPARTLPVTFTTDAPRDALHPAGVYTATVAAAFDVDAECELVTSRGDGGRVRVDVDPGHPLPPGPTAEPGDPTVSLGSGASVEAGAWESLALTGFAPGHVELLVDGAVKFTVRALADGTFTGHVPVPAATFAGDRVFTARQGEREVSTTRVVDSDQRPLANPIDRSTLRVHDVSSEETAAEQAPATNAIDGDPDTFWHTRWSGAAQPYPHHVTLDLGAAYDVTGLQYTTRQDAANGRMAAYEVYVSADGVEWGDPVASGSFTATLAPQTVDLTGTGRYLRLVGLSSVSGNAFGGAAEIAVGGVPVRDVPVTATAVSRCLAGTAYVAVRADNDGDAPVDMTIETAHGTREVAAVAPGRAASGSFSTRSSSVVAGEAAVVVAGTRVVVPYGALSC